MHEEEKSCKFQANPLVEKGAMDIDAKRYQHDMRILKRQREKRRMEKAEKELHELREQLRNEQELHNQEREV